MPRPAGGAEGRFQPVPRLRPARPLPSLRPPPRARTYRGSPRRGRGGAPAGGRGSGRGRGRGGRPPPWRGWGVPLSAASGFEEPWVNVASSKSAAEGSFGGRPTRCPALPCQRAGGEEQGRPSLRDTPSGSCGLGKGLPPPGVINLFGVLGRHAVAARVFPAKYLAYVLLIQPSHCSAGTLTGKAVSGVTSVCHVRFVFSVIPIGK